MRAVAHHRAGRQLGVPAAARLGASVALLLNLAFAIPAFAQNLNLDSVGAALALPVLTDYETDELTYLFVTNTSPDARVLHVNVISADNWRAFNFSCYVTASETTLFTFIPISDFEEPAVRLDFECTNPLTGESVPEETTLDHLSDGIFFVAQEDPESGGTTTENSLFGHALVVNFAAGSGYALDAFSFQGVDPGAEGKFDRDYRFDGVEYQNFPASLATNFIAPTGDGSVYADLILFTLDGTTGLSPGPQAVADMIFYDDDENPTSATFAFSCFEIVSLDEIDPNFLRENLGSTAGHLEFTPRLATQVNTTHDFLFDGGVGFDGVRRTPILGWIVQSAQPGAVVVPGEPPISGSLAWGRRLSTSRRPLIPSIGDVPTLSTASFP